MPQFVPWSSCEEWYNVRDLIFFSDNDSSKVAKGYEKLKIWKSRTPLLPYGVKCTLVILKGLYGPFEEETKSFAIFNFLKLCENCFQKEGNLKNLRQVCISKGLPDWLFRLRHEIAYDQSEIGEQYLNLALEECLQWIKQYYWIETADQIKNYTIYLRDSDLCDLLEAYFELNINKWKKEAVPLGLKNLLDRILKDQSVNCNNLDLLLSIILDRLKKFFNNNANSQSLFFASLINLNIVNDSLETEILQSEEFWFSWQDLMYVLYVQKLLPQFVEYMLHCFIRNKNSLLSFWIEYIFISILSTVKGKKTYFTAFEFDLNDELICYTTEQLKKLYRLVTCKFGQIKLHYFKSFCQLYGILEPYITTLEQYELMLISANHVPGDVKYCIINKVFSTSFTSLNESENFLELLNEIDSLIKKEISLVERPKKRVRIIKDFTEHTFLSTIEF